MLPSPKRLNSLALLRHGLLTWAACLAIALLRITLQPEHAFAIELTYSLAIGNSCWLLIELLRQVIHQPGDPAGWPRGARAAALIALGLGGGFIVGTAIGDAVLGKSSWQGVAQLKAGVVITAITGIGLITYFRNRGQRAALEAAAQEAARTAAEARLKLLEVQLEPHMLFNTLANLRFLVASDPPRAEAMLDHLIAYLRATLGGSRTGLHSLAEEFARLSDYLALMQVRMGDRLRFDLDLPDELRTATVPALLLQPLVENAIRHGLEPQVNGGRIVVRARAMASDVGGPGDGGGAPSVLVIEVDDDGAGLPPAASAAAPAFAQESAPQDTTASPFGNAQVRDRLATLYGARGTMSLIANSAGGACATVRFPLQFHGPTASGKSA